MTSRALGAGAVSIALLLSTRVLAFTLASQNPAQTGWANKTVTFKLNSSSCPSNIGEILNAATQVWNAVPTSSLVLKVDGGSTSTPTELKNGTAADAPVVACDPNFGTTFSVDANKVAGVGSIGVDTSPVDYGYLIINVQSGASANVANVSFALASIILAHEFGHALGLGHSADTAALMYYNATVKGKLSLSQDDIDGITYLYPRDETNGDPILGCGSLTALGRGGRGSGGPGFLPVFAAMVSPLLILLSLKLNARQKERPL